MVYRPLVLIRQDAEFIAYRMIRSAVLSAKMTGGFKTGALSLTEYLSIKARTTDKILSFNAERPKSRVFNMAYKFSESVTIEMAYHIHDDSITCKTYLSKRPVINLPSENSRCIR